ncbi:MAG: hypothetical protein VX367_05105, partial [SAR324 cluster bacterium]|nr:hypothetical protein [SAR324 cluster bacterium]
MTADLSSPCKNKSTTTNNPLLSAKKIIYHLVEAHEVSDQPNQDQVKSWKCFGCFFNPIAPKPEPESPSQFPNGSDFIAGVLEGKALIWGGTRVSNEGQLFQIPHEIIYSITVGHISERELHLSCHIIPADGDIHPGNVSATSVVLGDRMYILGGFSSGSFTNALSILTSAGEFKRLEPDGECPVPRHGSKGFSHGGKIYFLGGVVNSVEESRRENFEENQQIVGTFYSNELV